MTKKTTTTPLELAHEDLNRVQGGLFTLNIGTTEIKKSERPMGVLIGQQGNDFVFGEAGNDLIEGGLGRDT